MSDLKQLQDQLLQVSTLTTLTEAFEGIASARIRQVRDNVIRSRQFFTELWQLYSQLRLDPSSDLARRQQAPKSTRQLAIAITSTSALSGPIDQAIVEHLSRTINPAKTDIFVFGQHGAALLAERGLTPQQVFNLPDITGPLDVSPVTRLLDRYGAATVFYESFVSLSKQRVAQIELLAAVRTMSAGQTELELNVINLAEYIVEPSLPAVINYLQSVMMSIALVQVLLESRLAQYASRFNAMLIANDAAKQLRAAAQRDYFRARRALRDERSREVLISRRGQ